VDIALDEGTAASKKVRLSPAVQLAGLRASAPAPSVTTVAPSNPADVTGTISEPVKQSASLMSRWFGSKPAADDSAPAQPAAASASAAANVAAPETAKSKQTATVAKPASASVKAKPQAASPPAKPAKEITGATAVPPAEKVSSLATVRTATVAAADQLGR
jgi:fused signal recognition particle receptor